MRSCFDPKHLAMAGLLLAAAASGASTPAAAGGAGTGASPAAVGGNEIAVSRVMFSSIQDQYSKGNWMMIEVDFAGRTTSRANFISDVSFTLTLGWATADPANPFDLPLSTSVKLIGVFGGKPNAVLFFVPPEALARNTKGLPYDASRAPDYYTVEVKIADAEVPMGNFNYPPKLTNAERAKVFAAKAQSSALKGLMFSQATVPSYILAQALSKISSSVLPTPEAPDAGH